MALNGTQNINVLGVYGPANANGHIDSSHVEWAAWAKRDMNSLIPALHRFAVMSQRDPAQKMITR
jgi:hypothetical protein